MVILGTEVALPETYKKAIAGAKELELNVPLEAIVPGNDFTLPVRKIEKVDDQRLAYLENGDSYLFALVGEDVKEGGSYGFSLLNEKISVRANGEELLKAVEDEVALTGTFSKTEVKEKGDRVLHFFYNIGDYTVETAPEHGYKINSIDGDDCYKNTYRYQISRGKVRLVSEAEAGLTGTVTDYLDYGNIRFAKVTAAGQEFLIRVEPGFKADKVRLAFDSQDISVYSTRIDMKIC